MSLSRIKTWAAEILTFSDLNAEFNNILNNAVSLLSPLLANLAAGSFKITGLGAGTVAGDSVRLEQVGLATLTTIASAATPDIFAVTVGQNVDYTGTATATGFVAAPNSGIARNLICAGAAVFTAGANMLIDGVASGGNYTAAAGVQIKVTAVTTTQFRLTPPAPSFVPGNIWGLTLSNDAGDLTNDIGIAVGLATDGENTTTLRLNTALIKQLDVNWAVGTNAGFLDTGAVGNNTYHIYLIQRADTGVVDVLASLSATAPTMPASYVAKRRIGSIMREGAINVPFIQVGNYFRRTTGATAAAGNPGTAAVTVTHLVPTGITVMVQYNMHIIQSTAQEVALYASELSSTDSAPSVSGAIFSLITGAGAAAGTGAGQLTTLTNTSGQTRYRLTFSDASTAVRWITTGWFDTRNAIA